MTSTEAVTDHVAVDSVMVDSFPLVQLPWSPGAACVTALSSYPSDIALTEVAVPLRI